MLAIAPFTGLHRGLERFFDDVDGVSNCSARHFPLLNVWEDDESFSVEAEVPGLSMDALEVYVTDNELTIKGQRKQAEREAVTYHRRERGWGEFSRVLTFPSELDSSKVEASLDNGVLTLRLPKAESVKPRKIEIKVAE